MAFFAAMPKSATVWRISSLLIGRGATLGFRPEGVTLSCSGFTLDADIGRAPSKKSGCDIAPRCQSWAYINPFCERHRSRHAIRELARHSKDQEYQPNRRHWG